MLIVLCMIFLIIFIVGLIFLFKDEYFEKIFNIGFCMASIGGICLFIVMIALVWNISDVIQLKIIDQQIEMYQEENSNIQNSISEIIGNYMNYEQGTYAKSLESMDLKSLDIVVLSQLYPDLKANEMVNQQINIYQENNNKVKELKEKKLKCKLSKWWLYFGKVD